VLAGLHSDLQFTRLSHGSLGLRPLSPLPRSTPLRSFRLLRLRRSYLLAGFVNISFWLDFSSRLALTAPLANHVFTCG
jgi:hypothetical protein